MTPVPHRPGNTGDATRTFELIPTHHRDRPSTKLVTAINEFMFIITDSRVTSFDESVSEAKRPLGHASHVCVCGCGWEWMGLSPRKLYRCVRRRCTDVPVVVSRRSVARVWFSDPVFPL